MDGRQFPGNRAQSENSFLKKVYSYSLPADHAD
jgi:hypothetical protein